MDDSELINLINYGSSLSACQMVVTKKKQKYPNASLYQALDNLIAHKQGKSAHALKENLALVEKHPNDPQTVRILSEYFTSINRPVEALLVYENVAKRYPTLPSTQNLLLEWFDNSVLDPKLLAKVATLLSKCEKKRMYRFWSAFLYTINASLEKEAALYKVLGKRIIEDLKPLQLVHEVFLYTKFLNPEEIVSELAQISLPFDLDLQLIYVDALKLTENWKTLRSYTHELLHDRGFDDFDTWKLYIRAGKELDIAHSDVLGSPKPSRNSQLARVEAALVDGINPESELVAYHEAFASKACCFTDVKYYIERGVDGGALDFSQPKNTSGEETKTPTALDIQRDLTNHKLAYYVSKDVSDTDYIARSWELYKKYSNISTSGEFDNNPVNEFALQAVVLNIKQDTSLRNVAKNIAILQHLLKTDTHNHLLLLWLIRLCSYANINTYPYYNQLKIKMIQNDTLSHLLNTLAPCKDHLTLIVDIYRFYITAIQELHRLISQAFNAEIYNKLTSFIRFDSRLVNSVSRWATVAKVLQFLEVLGDNGYKEYFVGELAEFSFDTELRDNRDFSTEWSSLPFRFELDLDEPYSLVNTETVRALIAKYLVFYKKDETAYSHLAAKSGLEKVLYDWYRNLADLCVRDVDDGTRARALEYLQAEVSFSKIQEYFEGWATTNNVTLVIEFVKIARSFDRKKQLSAEISRLSKEVKAQRFGGKIQASLKGKVKTEIKTGGLDVEVRDVTREASW